jgi:glycosyltransferase involved in cell wall biosynthesis/SAM-dependent methyltransferase
MSRQRYRTNFAWDSPYGCVVDLVKRLSIEPGLVLDLGCGRGPLAEPLSDMGFKYVGLDIDEEALEDLRSRGYDGMALDLRREALVDDLADKFAGRRVALVLMLDVLEHIPNTKAFLRSLRAALLGLDRPVLILSVPNVGHADLGAKLAVGRFDYTSAGLLDENHVSLFTERRLSEELGAGGWLQVAAQDFVLSQSDQHFPACHPALAYGTPLAGFLSAVRDQADDYAHVNQFVRAYLLHRVEQDKSPAPAATPFLSVIVRTTGRRLQTLTEALTCLAAQTVDNFDVKLMVHTSGGVDPQVTAIVDSFHPTFSSRVEVIPVKDGGRSRPLNVGLQRSAGRYVAFLDDDDLVTGDWVERFRTGAENSPGTIVRSITLNQSIHRSGRPDMAYEVRSGLQHCYAPTFDLAVHFFTNQSPICSYAVPRSALNAFNLRFDESLPVTEDWEFLLRAAQITGVCDTGHVTSIYRRWVSDDCSSSTVDGSVWEGVRRSIIHRFDQAPILLPAQSASKVAAYAADHSRMAQMTSEVMDQRAEIDRLGIALQQAEASRDLALAHADRLSREKRAIEECLSMRVTLPLRKLLHYARRFLPATRRPTRG